MTAFALFCTLTTVCQVPYTSLISDISTNQKERDAANAIRTVFNMLGAAVCFLVPTLLMEQHVTYIETGGLEGISYNVLYIIIVVGFGLFFTVPLILAAVFTKERAPYVDVKIKFSLKEYAKPFKIKSFVYQLLMYIAAFFCMDVIAALALYYSHDVLRDVPNAILPSLFGVEMSAVLIIAPMMIMAGAMFPVVMWLMKKYNKQTAYRAGLPFYILGGIGLAIFNPSWTSMGWLVPIIAIVMGIGFSGAQIMPWIIFPDSVDVSELKTGERPAGTFGAIMTFSRKIANALAILMVGQILSAAGHVPDVTVRQSDSVLTAISLTMGITVVVVMGFSFFISLKYKVTEPKLSRVRYFIDKAKTNEELTPEEQAEKAALTKELC